MRVVGIRGAATAAILGLMALIPSMAVSQNGPPVSPPPAGNPLIISHDPARDEQVDITDGVRIGKLDVDVSIVGGVARTVALVRFDNPTNRPLEADFTLSMPAGSVISGYALDIQGRLVDGVLAPRRLATEAYEKRLRQQVDPGIAQVTRENAFHTKVFPVMPGGSRTVRLEFVSPVDGAGAYVLPLDTATAVKDLRLHVRADDARSIDGPAGAGLNAARVAGGGWEGAAEGGDRTLKGALRVDLSTPAAAVSVTRHHSGDTFVQVNDAPPAASTAGAGPERVRLYWDTSLSRRRGGLDAERALAARYLDAAHPQAIDLILFADGEPRVASFTSAKAALAAIDAIDYRGATSLARVLSLSLPSAGACLMFSDGNIDLDAYRITPVGCPLYTISSAGDANHSLLTALARRSGGEHMDLRGAGADSIVARLMSSATRITAVTTADGQPVAYALAPAQDGRFRIIAPMPAGGALRVSFAGGGSRAYQAADAAVARHDGAGDLWAAARLGEMTASDQPDEDRVMAFARRYSVASPAADFVVLETPQDYLDIKTPPPASFGKEGLAAYEKALAERKREEADARKNRLDEVAGRWNEQQDWWEQVFQPRRTTNKPPAQALARPTSPAAGEPRAAAASAPPPAPPPPPPPPPAPRGLVAGNADVSEVTVTAQKREETLQNVPVAVSAFSQDSLERAPSASGGTVRQIEVEAAEWNPDRPYLDALNADPKAFASVFKDQQAKYGDTPAFYFDVSEWLYRKGRKQEAAAMVVNVLELPDADLTTLAILADRLDRYGEESRAIWLYERILYLHPEWPQPRRNLALALIRRADRLGVTGGSPTLRRADYSRAADLLNEIISKPWDDAYDGVEMISLMEINRILPAMRALGVDRIPLDPRLIRLMDVDLRIVLEWNTDHTDMDLWVDEPGGERAIYSNPNTQIGGRLSNDMTEGYGPEEYLLRRAPYGTYQIQVNVYAADRIDPNGATVIRAHLYRDWGRPTQKEESFEIELKRGDDGAMLVGSFTVSRGPATKH